MYLYHYVYLLCSVLYIHTESTTISIMLVLLSLENICQFSTTTSYNIIANTVTVTNVQVDCLIMTALIVAAYMGHVDIVQMLLPSGKVHVDQKDRLVSMLLIIHSPLLFISIYCMYRILLNESVYCVVFRSSIFIKYFSNIIMSNSLIHILIISAHPAIYFCFILLCVSNILSLCMVYT